MTRLVMALALLAGCEPGAIHLDSLDAPEPGVGWAGEPYEEWDTGAPDELPDYTGSTLRILAPRSASVLVRGESHAFQAEVRSPSGQRLTGEGVDVVWTSAQDTTWLGMGLSFEDDGLDIGFHTLTAQATLPDGTSVAHTVGAVLVQSPYSGTYAGLYSVDITVAGILVTCTGSTTILVDPWGEGGYGEGGCIVSIPVLGGDIPLHWVFEPQIAADGSVTGTVGVSGFGLFTYDFPSEGVVQPTENGFNVQFAGSIPIVGQIKGFYRAPRVSIQSF